MSSLKPYRNKRDFDKTGEPAGAMRGFAAPPEARAAFVIQKHAARRLHHDLRLELDGVFKSWAVPKGLSLDPGQRRLAVHVEDHPLEYGSFEGVVPKGEYGGGTVMLWDKGSWEAIGDAREGYRKGELKFRLKGRRLRGSWVLVRLRPRPEAPDDDNWLVIKERDDEARPGTPDTWSGDDRSITTGRTMSEIAGGRESSPRSRPAGASPAEGVALPASVKASLATGVAEPPAGNEWLHEIKYDGYRVMARLRDGEVRLVSRSGRDWTARFPGVTAELERLQTGSAWLDGEVVAFRPDGVSDLGVLERARESGDDEAISYVAFDLLHLDGTDLRAESLLERKKQLRKLLRGRRGRGASAVRLSDHLAGSGREFFAAACERQLDGIVSKRVASVYVAGRTGDWLVCECGDRPSRAARSAHAGPTVAGVVISHPERVIYPGTGLTKLDVVRYYDGVAELMLPYLAGRPLTVIRCPMGTAAQCFFQKHVTESVPDLVRRVTVVEDGEATEYPVVESREALVAMVQMGALEFHVRGSRVEQLEAPDQIVFDLDPAPDVAWREVRAAARRLRTELGDRGLESLLKTSGGKGLHIVVPLKPEASWEAVGRFAREVALHLVDLEPGKYTATMSKAKRTGKVFIDHFRNGRGATAVAPYSLRARDGAPAALPLAWSELGATSGGAVWTAPRVLRRLGSRRADPWAGAEALYRRQRLKLPRG